MIKRFPWRLFVSTALILAITLALVLMLEGGVSFYQAVAAIHDKAEEPVVERKHTRYDSELGWINIPDFFSPDLYGDGVYLKANSKSFRNAQEFDAEIPPGWQRAVCSGDSFTMGVGVANTDTWCHLLRSEFDKLQTVNMGQGGYGIDQAYLWYMRDGRELEHDVHLFSFITDDFFRMLRPEFIGYGKPLLSLDKDGELVTKNVPVPRTSYLMPWVTRNTDVLREIDTFRLFHDYFSARAREQNDAMSRGVDFHPLARAVFRNLARVNREKGSRLLVVYIPVEGDYRDDSSRPYRAFVARELSALGVAFLDLVPELRKLDRREVSGLYLRGVGSGHFNRSGNRWVAGHVANALNAFGVLTPAETRASASAWQAQYFSNKFLRGAPARTVAEPEVAHNWGGGPPGPDLPQDGFSARWRACLELDEERPVAFYLASDDGARLSVNGKAAIDHWFEHGYESRQHAMTLPRGSHLLEVEYFESGGGAAVELRAAVGDGYPQVLSAPVVRPLAPGAKPACSSPEGGQNHV